MAVFCSSLIYAQNAKDNNDNFKKAIRYFYEKKFEMAELLLQEELQKNPENKLAYSYLGDIFLTKKQYDAALALYQKSLDLDPNDAENYFRIGQIYYYKKMGDLSISNYQKSIELNPQNKFILFHIGLSELMLKRDKEATIKSWENYIRIAPEDPQYEKIRRAIEILRDPKFELPPPDSDIPIEEVLHMGGSVLTVSKPQSEDIKAGGTEKKTNEKVEDIYQDNDLN